MEMSERDPHSPLSSPARLVDLFRSLDWSKVRDSSFLQLEVAAKRREEGLDGSLETFRTAFEEMRQLEATPNEGSLEFPSTYEVCARPPADDAVDDDSDPPDLVALDFCPWTKVLGMKVNPNELERLGPEEVVARSIWEMTFYGSTSAESQAAFTSITGAAERDRD